MLNETVIDMIATSAALISYENIFNIEAILSLLVEKGLFTAEEYNKRKEFIMKSEETATQMEIYDSLQERFNGVSEAMEYDKVFEKFFNGSITEEERDALLEKLEKTSKTELNKLWTQHLF